MATDLTTNPVAMLELGPQRAAKFAELTDRTLEAGAEMTGYWGQLEPVVRELIRLVDAQVKADVQKWKPTATASLLATVATVVEKLAKAGQGMLRAAEGQARVHALLTGGVVVRKDAKTRSERELVGVVLETAKRLWKEQGVCPVCQEPVALEVTP